MVGLVVVPTPHPGGVAGGVTPPALPVAVVGVVVVGDVVLVDGVVLLMVELVVPAVPAEFDADGLAGLVVITPDEVELVVLGQLAAVPVGVVAIPGVADGVVVLVDGVAVLPGRVDPVAGVCVGFVIAPGVPMVFAGPTVAPGVAAGEVGVAVAGAGEAVEGVCIVGLTAVLPVPAAAAPACASANPDASNTATASNIAWRVMRIPPGSIAAE